MTARIVPFVCFVCLVCTACSDDGDDSVAVPSPDIGLDTGMDAVVEDEVEAPEDAAPEVIEDVVDEEVPEPFSWEAIQVEPMALVDGLPLIEGRVDGQGPLSFVVDTLSQAIFVDVDVVGDDLFHEAEVSIGSRDLGTVIVKGRPMTPDERFAGVDIGGLVGQAYLSERFTVVDYPRRRFYLSDEVPPVALPPPGYEDAPRQEVLYELPNLLTTVNPTIGAAGEVVLLGDTSSRMSYVTRRVFDAVDDGSLPRVEGWRFSSNFGEDPAFLTRLPSVRFGDLEVEGLEVAVIPDEHHLKAVLEPNMVFAEGFLGAGFWARFALGIDGNRIDMGGMSEGGTRTFVLWGDGSEPQDWAGRWDKVGIEVALAEDQVVVEMVFVGTGAEGAGLVPGAVIEAIDGAPVAEAGLEAVRDMLRGEVGEPRSMRVRLPGEGEAAEVSVEVEEILP